MPLPANGRRPEPDAITTGWDNNIWFTDPGTDTIGPFNPFTKRFVTPISLSSSLYSSIFPYFITSGSDGNMWFTTADLPYGVAELQRKVWSLRWEAVRTLALLLLKMGRCGTRKMEALGHIDVKSVKFLPTATPPSRLFPGLYDIVTQLIVGKDGCVWFVGGTISSHWIGV